MDDPRIEYPAKYEAAKQARIKRNAAVGRSRRWFAANADAQRLTDWLNHTGEFRRVWVCGHNHDDYDYLIQHPEYDACRCKTKVHPAASFGAFYEKMAESLLEWGGLTENQTAAVRNGMEKALERVKNRDADKAAQRANDLHSVHVGEVGKRADFEAVVEFAVSYETQFGLVYLVSLRDADGNVLVIKGSRSVGVVKGQKIRFAAFVKSHGERDGIKQTILNRAKIKEVVGE